MRSIIFTSFLAVCLALPAFAGPPKGCYVRHYTEAHLAKNPAQVVASIWMRFAKWDADIVADLSVVTANQGHARRSGLGGLFYDQMLFCWPDTDRGKGAWGCAVECDGGSMEIIRDDGEVLEFRTQRMMVGDTEGCGGVVDIAEKPMTWVTYRLYRTNDAECESN